LSRTLFDALNPLLGERAKVKPPIVISHTTNFSVDSDSGSQSYHTPSRSQSRDDLETSTPGPSDPHLTGTKHRGKKKRKLSSSQSREDSQSHIIDIFERKWEKDRKIQEEEREERKEFFGLMRMTAEALQKLADKD